MDPRSKGSSVYWTLGLKDDKTKVMLLKSSSSESLNIFINNTPIKQVKDIKYLGTQIDQNLSCQMHTNNLCKSLSFKVYSFVRLMKFLNARLLKILYRTIIQSCLDYCCSVWGNCNNRNKAGLIRLQKRAARFVTGNFDFFLRSWS